METFSQYRDRVLGYLGTRDPIRVQRATPAALERRLRGRSTRQLARRPDSDKWSVAEIVAHMADAELAMGWRLRSMLATPGVALSWWDQDRWAERLGYATSSPREYAALFRALRVANLRLLLAVPRAWWDECHGVHEVRGRQSVADFVALEAGHDLNHLAQIDRILLHGRPNGHSGRRPVHPNVVHSGAPTHSR
jgi:hypothetical protein